MKNTKEYPKLAYVLIVERKDENGINRGSLGVVKWGENGYYKTDFESHDYTQKDVDEFNSNLGLSHAEGEAMMICSMNGNLKNWEKHYNFVLGDFISHEVEKESEESKNG